MAMVLYRVPDDYTVEGLASEEEEGGGSFDYTAMNQLVPFSPYPLAL